MPKTSTLSKVLPSILLSSRPTPLRRTQFSVSPTHTWAKCRFAAPKLVTIDLFARQPVSPQPLLIKPYVLLAPFGLNDPRPTILTGPLFFQTTLVVPPLYLRALSSYHQFYNCTITSPDSAPGADGIPYSAWRVCPSATASCLQLP